MTVYDNPLTSYGDTTPFKRVITDVISMIDPRDTPLIDALGGLDGAAGKFRLVNWPSTTVEWLEDTLFALAGSLNADTTSVTTTLTVTDASIFEDGDILQLVNAASATTYEQVWCSSVSTANNTIVVTRGYGGTQASNSSAGALGVITIIGQARLEGDDSDPRAFTDKTVNSNFTQIHQHEVKVTRTMNQLSQYGLGAEFDYQATKAVPGLLRLVERHLFNAAAVKAGSATTPRAMGGLPTFITTNTVSSASLTQANLEDAAELAYNSGGLGPWIAPISSKHFQVLKNMYDSSSYLRVDRQETTVGMVIHAVETPFGLINFVLDRWSPNSRINLVDTKHAGLLTFSPFTQKPLAVTGDSIRGEVVGEFTLCCRQNLAHAAVIGLS